MSRRPRAAMLLPPVLLVAMALSLAACGEAGPSASPSAVPTTPSPTPVAIDLPVPDADTALEQVLLENADGDWDAYASIGQLQGAAASCTAVLLDTGGPATGPAFALTNGHCVGITGANELVVDRAGDGMAVAFDWFVDAPEHHVVPVTRVAWASMRGTDLAVLELDATPGDLRDAGLVGWRPETLPAGEGASVDVVMLGVPVGVPLADIPEAERYLRIGTCSLDADPVRLNERQWLWTAALRNDCPQVLPGNSGSAVLDRETGGLVGLINTTTYKGEAGAECWLGRPCEVDEEREASLPDTSYAQPVGGIERCFGGDGAFALGGACPLDPGTGVVSLDDAPLAVNPANEDPLSGRPSPSTWATTVVTDGAETYRYRIGPLYGTDCADEAGYSDPVPVSTPIDDPLPREEQRLLLCVIADGQDPVHAAMAVAYIDTTPPQAETRFAVTGNRADGWRIEPVFNPPELSLFLVKSGPAKRTDCDDPDSYAPYRRNPILVDGADAPVRFCAIGFDDANNAARPAGKLLR